MAASPDPALHRCLIESPVGPLAIDERNGAIVALSFVSAASRPGSSATPLLARAERQLAEYFAARRRCFDLPLAPAGTPFQKRVWRALLRIPFGESRSYGELAAELSSAPRALGQACGQNPITILIPCHRVLGAHGSLGGYSGGRGLKTKRFLLALEGALLA